MRILLLLLPILLFALSVNVRVNKHTINIGEELVITISAEGKNVKFPNIQDIDGNTIVGISNSKNISIINEKTTEIITKSFVIYPKKDLTIPSFTIIINGKTYHTKPIKIKVIEPKQTKGNFELDINVSKHNLYLGESAILTLKFTKKINTQSIQIQKPYIQNFLIKNINSKEIKTPTKYTLIYKFLIIPQKIGNYKIGPFIAQVGTLVKTYNDNLLNFSIASIKYKNIYSNRLKIKVKPIPYNTIYGDFNISLKAKNKLKTNEPNKVQLNISGCGDLYSIKPFNLNIKDVTVYQEKPKIILKIKNDKLCGNYIQNFTILSNKSYSIPSLKLNTFNGSVHTIFTPKINVTIKTSSKFNTLQQTPNITQKKESTNIKIILLISLISLAIGILVGFIIFKLYIKITSSEFTKIKKANEKELLNLLKKYEYNNQIKNIMEQLEENIYKNKNNQINKKEIIKIIKSLRK